MISKTFTAASPALSTFALISESPDVRGDQSIRLFAEGNASGSATLRLALVRAGQIVMAHDLPVTATTIRTAPDGISGNFILAIELPQPGYTFDLLGSEIPQYGAKYGSGLAGNFDEGAVWMIGCVSLTTITSLKVSWKTTAII